NLGHAPIILLARPAGKLHYLRDWDREGVRSATARTVLLLGLADADRARVPPDQWATRAPHRDQGVDLQRIRDIDSSWDRPVATNRADDPGRNRTSEAKWRADRYHGLSNADVIARQQ